MDFQIDREFDRAITVRQLIEMLENFDQDSVVTFQYPSGDHWNTVLASTIQEVGEETVEYSSYHDQLKIAEESTDSESRKVVMIF